MTPVVLGAMYIEKNDYIVHIACRPTFTSLVRLQLSVAISTRWGRRPSVFDNFYSLYPFNKILTPPASCLHSYAAVYLSGRVSIHSVPYRSAKD